MAASTDTKFYCEHNWEYQYEDFMTNNGNERWKTKRCSKCHKVVHLRKV